MADDREVGRYAAVTATGLMLHTDADLVLVTSSDGRCLDVSPNVSMLLGLSSEDVIGASVCELLDRADLATVGSVWDRIGRDGRVRATIRLRHRDGTPVWLDVAGQVLQAHPRYGSSVRLFSAREVTGEVDALEHLAESEQRWRVAFEHSPIGAALVSAAGDITLANASFAAMLGYRADELGRLSVAEVTHPDDRELDGDKLASLLSGEQHSYTVEKRLVTAAGGLVRAQITVAAVPDRHGEVSGVIVQVQDVTQRRDAELQLADRTLHDPLTGLASRLLVQEWLAGALQDNQGRDVGVLHCDLDRFKLVNDSLGHNAGDAVITEAAARLRAAVRPDDLVGRVGGDQFVVVCERVADEDELLQLASRLAAVLDEPIGIDSHLHTVTLSVGAATGRSPDTADEVLMRAHLALRRAKLLGRARVERFDASVDRVATRGDLELEDELRGSVGNNQLRAYYQPIVTLTDRRIVGHEALLRWDHPQRGILTPEDFLDIAETSGLIRSLGTWILDTACRDSANGRIGQPPSHGWVAVNASPSQLTRADVFQFVTGALERSRLSPTRLHIEITETTLMQASPSLVNELQELRAIGVGIVLDDFGTGFSSLSLLRDFPVSMVKIDKSFIAPLLRDPGALAIVRAVLGMCHDLAIPVVAEGVETESQADRLAELGCSHVQGYLLGRPQAAATANSELARNELSAPVGSLT